MLDLLPAFESMDPRDVIRLQTVEAQNNVIGERGAKRSGLRELLSGVER